MKRNYEIALMQHVQGSVEDDYETVDFISWCSNYYEFKRMAKEISKHIGEINVPHSSHKFVERQPNKEFWHKGLDEGLAMVKIVCYTETEFTTYAPIYYEYYKDGKVDYKVTFDEPMF